MTPGTGSVSIAGQSLSIREYKYTRDTVGRIYKEDHYTLLHTKYESSGPCGFEIFYVFPIVRAIYCHVSTKKLCATHSGI